jgi:hypothetical protein
MQGDNGFVRNLQAESFHGSARIGSAGVVSVDGFSAGDASAGQQAV